MTRHRRTVAHRWAAVGAAAIALLLAPVVMSATAAADDELDPDGTLTITVTEDADPSPSPSPTPSGAPATPAPPTLPGRPTTGGPGGAIVSQEPITDPVAADAALGDDPIDLGPLSMSGLSAAVSPSLLPDGGTVTLSFTVRNTSSTAFDSTARLWITTVVGATVADVAGVRVDALAPAETRTVRVTVSGLGQSTLLQGHTTFTPPEEVDGTRLSPLTRDAMIFLPPLFLGSVVAAVALVAGAWGLRRIGRLRMPLPLPASGARA